MGQRTCVGDRYKAGRSSSCDSPPPPPPSPTTTGEKAQRREVVLRNPEPDTVKNRTPWFSVAEVASRVEA